MLETEKRIATLVADQLSDLEVVIATDDRRGGLQAQYRGESRTLHRQDLRKMLQADSEQGVATLFADGVRQWCLDLHRQNAPN